MSRYLKGIADDLVITFDEIIDAVAKSYDKPTKTAPINFDEKNAVCKMENFYVLFGFLLITISQLIIVRVIILLR